MPIYTVTFCTMDQEAGANPFWHTCLLLSSYDENTKKIEVVDNWGFYGLPSTISDSILRRVKIKIGLDVDLEGNHGMLRHEEMRYLDLGCGLHGATFELTKEKFDALQNKCQKMAAEQEQAIEEAAKTLHLDAKTPDKTRIYPYEAFSTKIFAIEQEKSKLAGRPSRLKPFTLTLSAKANTCKVQVLRLMEGILKPEQIKRLSGHHHAISRFSGKMETIFLHSSGPMKSHIKRSGEAVYFRDGTDKDVKLHWTLPPQEIETISGEVKNLFKLHSDHCDDVKKTVRQLQKLEWLFRNSAFDKKYFPQRDKLIAVIKEQYEVFATIEPKKPNAATHNSWSNSLLWLFSQPRDENENKLMESLADAKDLLNHLYMAIVDDWKFNEPEISSSNKAIVGDEKSVTLDEKTIPNETDDEDIETLAAYLPIDKKKELCKIVGRNYINPAILTLEKASM